MILPEEAEGDLLVRDPCTAQEQEGGPGGVGDPVTEQLQLGHLAALCSVMSNI